MGTVTWSAQAKSDLYAIHDWIAASAPRTAERFVADLVAATATWARHPKAGRLVPETGHDERFRERFHGAYRIIYQPTGSGLRILTVISSHRRLSVGLPLPQLPDDL